MDISGDGGVLLESTQAGNGVKPKAGQTVFAHYTGRLQDGSVFDSSRGKPHREEFGFYFSLGAGEVIKGWDVGMAAMSIGEQATITCRYDYAYGAQGMPQSGIPGETAEASQEVWTQTLSCRKGHAHL